MALCSQFGLGSAILRARILYGEDWMDRKIISSLHMIIPSDFATLYCPSRYTHDEHYWKSFTKSMSGNIDNYY